MSVFRLITSPAEPRSEHEFDNGGFWCTRCGCSRSDADQSEYYAECPATDNVVAISHVVRDHSLLAEASAKRLQALHATAPSRKRSV